MTADEVRAIVREELQAALKVLQAKAERYAGYDTDVIEDTAARMLGSVAESAADALLHTPECETRTNKWAYHSDCNCGVRA